MILHWLKSIQIIMVSARNNIGHFKRLSTIKNLATSLSFVNYINFD